MNTELLTEDQRTCVKVMRDRQSLDMIVFAFECEHRTNQQSILNLCYQIIMAASERCNLGLVDARNNTGLTIAKRIVDTEGGIPHLPYV